MLAAILGVEQVGAVYLPNFDALTLVWHVSWFFLFLIQRKSRITQTATVFFKVFKTIFLLGLECNLWAFPTHSESHDLIFKKWIQNEDIANANYSAIV